MSACTLRSTLNARRSSLPTRGVPGTAIDPEASKYEFGDSGGILVLVNDEDGMDEIKYSLDEGGTFKSYNLSVRMRAQVCRTRRVRSL